MRNFANKIWNASRFVMMNLTIDECRLPEKLELEDKWILSKFNNVVKEVTENMEKYELGVAAQKVYDFIWDSFCDWYIELTKTHLQGEDEDSKLRAQQVLCWVLTETMKLLHPFMPFLTEEIWQALPHEGDFLITSAWPTFDPAHDFAAEEAEMETVMAAIKAVRALRAEKNVPPSKKPHLFVETAKREAFEAGVPFLKKLAYAAEVTVSAAAPENAGEMAAAVTTDAKLYMPLAELVDVEKELARLRKELQKAENDHQRTAAKLTNEAFLSKAPAQVVAAEKEKVARLEALIANLRASVETMEKM
jgi:valyl-tRNA synthetase